MSYAHKKILYIVRLHRLIHIHKSICVKQVVQSTEYIYNVTDDGRSFVVHLKNKTCSCGKFQDEEIPCEHVWVVLKRKSLVANGYCSHLYKSKTV